MVISHSYVSLPEGTTFLHDGNLIHPNLVYRYTGMAFPQQHGGSLT